jgi:hypothetical protein
MPDVTKPLPRSGGLLAPLTGPIPEIWKLQPHPLADEYPMADASEYAGLRESIRQHGVREPVTLYDDGSGLKILDGRTRVKGGIEVAYEWRPENFRVFTGTPAEAALYVYEMNSLRRHLSKEQKEQFVLKLLAKYPDMASRKLVDQI